MALVGPGVDCVGLMWTGWACIALCGPVVDWVGLYGTGWACYAPVRMMHWQGINI